VELSGVHTASARAGCEGRRQDSREKRKTKGENEGVEFDRVRVWGVSESGEWDFLQIELGQAEL
jgi:hypothetical protein